jgi:predicted NUDIX family NTP pyrophosphohydrolase
MAENKSKRISAGLMMYRIKQGKLEVLLVHPGGPFFKNKDIGVWSVPKGEPDDGEDALFSTALREFEEETGIKPEGKKYIPLGSIQQRGGKTVHAWAFEGDMKDGFEPKSNTFKREWPPHSGKFMIFPEADRIEFFESETAKKKIKDRQVEFIERLEQVLSGVEGL